MPRICKVCSHPRLDEINKTLIESMNISEIARKFGLPWDSLKRHKKLHLPALLMKSEKLVEIKAADSIIDRLLFLANETMEIYKEARKTRNYGIALTAIARAEKQAELQAKLIGELKEFQQVNIEVVVPALLQILNEEIRDTATLERISNRLSTIN